MTVITHEADDDRALGVRPSVSAVIVDRETLDLRYVPAGRMPATLLPNHRVRIRDARARRAVAFVR